MIELSKCKCAHRPVEIEIGERDQPSGLCAD
jgi:hypothetical protein